jgi:hypothetical protein
MVKRYRAIEICPCSGAPTTIGGIGDFIEPKFGSPVPLRILRSTAARISHTPAARSRALKLPRPQIEDLESRVGAGFVFKAARKCARSVLHGAIQARRPSSIKGAQLHLAFAHLADFLSRALKIWGFRTVTEGVSSDARLLAS